MENKKLTYGEDLTIEQVKAQYFDEDAILLKPRTVYRMDNRGRRFYFVFDENNKPKFAISVTSFIAASLPTSPYLVDWMIAQGSREQANQARDEAAAYGTLLHREIGTFLIQKRYDLDQAANVVAAYVEAEKLPFKCLKWTEKLKRDLAAFAQFCIDVDFKPIAIEMMLLDEKLGLGGAIDIMGEMNVEEAGFYGEVYKTGANAGKPKETKMKRRVRAIVDIKSGRNGFYETHEVQLKAYRTIWNNYFTEYPVQKCFNWAPSDWRTNPGYKLKDQTDTPKSFKFDYLLAIAQIEAAERDVETTLVSGVMELNKPLENNVKTLGVDQVVLMAVERFQKENEPEPGPGQADFDKMLDMEDDEQEINTLI